MSSRATGRPASRRIRIQSNPFSFGLRAQPGAPMTGRSRALPTSIRLPGSTGMPKCSMRPPDRLERGGNDVTPIGNGRGAEHDHHSAPSVSTCSIACASAALLMRHAALGNDLGACGLEPLRRHLQRLVDHLGRKPRQQRRDDADLADAIGRDTDQRLRLSGNRKRSIALCHADSERNDLHGRDHFAFDDRLVGRQRCKGDRFIDRG